MGVPISILIKTFERPEALTNLLRSIRSLRLAYPVIIADDSKQNYEVRIKAEFKDLPIQYINLPFDTGLSEGRNILVNKVKTPYFLLCDDDYVFDERTDITRAYEELTRNNADLVGGDYYNYVNITGFKMFIRQLNHPLRLLRFFFNRYQTARYLGNFKITGKSCELLITNKRPATSFSRTDLVNNFFLAKTESVKSMGGWDKYLKMGEHEDFFLRAKQKGLQVGYLADFGTRHYPAIPLKSSSYNQYRVRAEKYKNVFIQKHGFESYIERDTDRGIVLFKSR